MLYLKIGMTKNQENAIASLRAWQPVRDLAVLPTATATYQQQHSNSITMPAGYDWLAREK